MVGNNDSKLLVGVNGSPPLGPVDPPIFTYLCIYNRVFGNKKLVDSIQPRSHKLPISSLFGTHLEFGKWSGWNPYR